MSESYESAGSEEPTQAVTPGAEEYQSPDDPGQDDARMVDPVQAAGAEFPSVPEEPAVDTDPVEPPD